MKRRNFSQRLTDALRGDTYSILRFLRWMALITVFYYIIDWLFNPLVTFSLIGGFFVGTYLESLME